MTSSPCTSTTKAGARCTRPPLSWPGPWRPDQEPWTSHCYNHLTAAERTRYLHEAREERDRASAARRAWLAADPACWSWPVPDDVDCWQAPLPFEVGPGDDQISQATADMLMASLRSPEGRGHALLDHWQAGRCALCGHRGEHLVEDHDHATGMVRGLLCRGCNTREGTHRSADGLFARYRSRPPTVILGLSLRYWDPFLNDYAQPRSDADTEDEEGDPLDEVPVYQPAGEQPDL